MKIQKLIFIVEDDDRFFNFLVEFILFKNKEIEIIRALDLKEGEELFFENKGKIDLVLMDACVPGHEPNSMNLIRNIKQTGFSNPIIGMSNQEAYLFKLKEAGADFSFSKTDLSSLSKFVVDTLS